MVEYGDHCDLKFKGEGPCQRGTCGQYAIIDWVVRECSCDPRVRHCQGQVADIVANNESGYIKSRYCGNFVITWKMNVGHEPRTALMTGKWRKDIGTRDI